MSAAEVEIIILP